MSRKDTILIAILVNIGVLTVLFMTSIKHQPLLINAAGEIAIETKSGSLVAPKQALDQVDLVLSQYEEKKKTAEVSPPPPEIPKKEPEMIIPATTYAFESKTEGKKELPATVTFESTHPTDWMAIEVKSGDVLEKIARHHGCTVEEIKKANHLSSPHLYIGQTLYVPKASVRSQAQTHSSSVSEPIYYVVKPGDNPWTIAMKNQLKIEELLRLNNLDELKAKKLKPGDKLRIK